MIKKILQAVGFGLFCAGLILYVAPWVNNQLTPLATGSVMSFHEAVKTASPAVVNVYSQSFDVDSNSFEVKAQSSGSGVIMTADGYILTNKHVIQNADQIVVALQSGTKFMASVVGSDTLTDLAVLKIQADQLPTVPQNPKRPIRVGDIVLAIGNPFNLGQSITQGIISATERNAVSEGGRQNFIQTDAPINQGNSGGALVNSKGELLGISTLRLGKNNEELAEGLNFAIPINLANQIMTKIIQDGRVIRGYFGVNSSLYNQLNEGVLIEGVAQGGPAERAGIEAGDIILKLNNIDAKSPAQMMALIAETKPNTPVKVQVSRQGKIFDFNVVIGEFPDYN